MIPNYFYDYRMPILDPGASSLWLILCTEDKRPLRQITPNYWTPPMQFTYTKLSLLLQNRKNPRASKRLLKVLHRQKLVRVRVSPGTYKLEIQAWRMPALLTPYLYNRLPPRLQKKHDTYIEQHGELYNLSGGKEQWLQIKSHYLEPLMPAYTDYDIEDNFETDQE